MKTAIIIPARYASTRYPGKPLAELRTKRNQLLAETDYLALSDTTLSSDMTTYRQALRDLTSGLDTVDKINNVTWPTKPS